MLWEIEQAAGIHSLSTLSGESVLESLNGLYVPQDESSENLKKVEELADSAASVVASDWGTRGTIGLLPGTGQSRSSRSGQRKTV
jgi:hypothetical protein